MRQLVQVYQLSRGIHVRRFELATFLSGTLLYKIIVIVKLTNRMRIAVIAHRYLTCVIEFVQNSPKSLKFTR